MELENIDDEADQLGIAFVKINDEELAKEYNLGELPKLVYYRHQIPIIYEGKKFVFLSYRSHWPRAGSMCLLPLKQFKWNEGR